jgi:hypothetical protein
MAYVAGDTILDDEYNTFVGSAVSPYGYNHFAGTGSGEYGMGQTPIATVSAGGTIQASEWNSLFTALDNIADHTNDTITSRAAVSAGDTIAIKAAVETDLATLAASVAGGCVNATALTTSSALQTVTTASEGWDTSATQEVSVTFADADTMRHFFNAGGKVRVTVGTTQASTDPKDTAFIDLGTALGNIDIAAQSTLRSGSGETLTTNGLANGFHDLTTSYTTLIKLTSDNSNYTSNTVEISAKLDAAVGTAITMTIKMVATDPAADSQYTSPNTSSVPAAVKDTPRMVTTLFTLSPNTSQGLGTALGINTSNTVSNTTV